MKRELEKNGLKLGERQRIGLYCHIMESQLELAELIKLLGEKEKNE